MKNSLWIASALLCAAPLTAQEPTTASPAAPADSKASTTAAKSQEAAAATLWPASELQWKESAAVKGGRQAVLWGDPEKEGYGRLNRWPAGSEVSLHHHPFEVRGVVLEGTVTITPEGGAARELGPGSYWHLPGRMAHVTTCKPGADCLFLTTSKMRHETRMGAPRQRPTP